VTRNACSELVGTNMETLHIGKLNKELQYQIL